MASTSTQTELSRMMPTSFNDGSTPMAKGIEKSKKNNQPKLSTKEKQKKKKEKKGAK